MRVYHQQTPGQTRCPPARLAGFDSATKTMRVCDFDRFLTSRQCDSCPGAAPGAAAAASESVGPWAAEPGPGLTVTETRDQGSRRL